MRYKEMENKLLNLLGIFGGIGTWILTFLQVLGEYGSSIAGIVGGILAIWAFYDKCKKRFGKHKKHNHKN